MTSPYFSVVMAVHNAMPELPLAMESMLHQTFSDFELIIIDDHSTDSSRDYLASLNDPRIQILFATLKGQTPALNQGIRQSRSNWIVRMDGDDWSDPRRLAMQKAAIDAAPGKTVLVTSDYWICDDSLDPVAPVHLEAPNPRLQRYLEIRNNPFCHPTVVLHAPTLKAVGLYDEAVQNAQDYRLYLKLLQKGNSIHVPELLLKYRVRRGALSVLFQDQQSQERKEIQRQQGDTTQTFEKKEGRVQTPRRIEGIYHYKLGFSAWLAGYRTLVWSHFARVIPAGGMLALKAILLLALTVFPRKVYMTIAGYNGVYR